MICFQKVSTPRLYSSVQIWLEMKNCLVDVTEKAFERISFFQEIVSAGLLLKAAWDSKSLFSLLGLIPLPSRQAHGLHRWAPQLVPESLGEAGGADVNWQSSAWRSQAQPASHSLLFPPSPVSSVLRLCTQMHPPPSSQPGNS